MGFVGVRGLEIATLSGRLIKVVRRLALEEGVMVGHQHKRE